MQGSMYWRCFRAGELLLHKAENMILNSQALKPTTYLHHQYRIPTRRLSTNKRNPWDSSRTSSTGFKQIKAFISDFPAKTPPDGKPNGYAMFSTSDGGSKKPVETQAAAEGDQISDARIISTLAKYLWMKDNFEFRFRVIAALTLLVGAKVVNVQVPFLFKLAVDWLTTATGNASALTEFTTANSTLLALFVSPAAVLIGYGIARSGASAFNGTSHL